MKNKKTQILDFLKRFGRMPTSKIGVLIGLPSSSIKIYLEELKQEKLIIEEKETNATYWRLKE